MICGVVVMWLWWYGYGVDAVMTLLCDCGGILGC